MTSLLDAALRIRTEEQLRDLRPRCRGCGQPIAWSAEQRAAKDSGHRCSERSDHLKRRTNGESR